ncbi:MAG: trypsin-like peptidase domain-containing protein [Bauldia sp.]|nr:trypsin-like peptidase domain-containing protein [Bauldia sp.]
MSGHIVARRHFRATWRDWKGDPVSSARRVFGKRIPIPIPPELTDEPALLAYLKLSPAELKRIWWFRRRMYSQFEIAKGSGKVRLITAPDRRLKIIQQKLRPVLEQLYRVRDPVHGFVLQRSVKTNAESHGGRRFVVNLDLKDFFPTITEKRIVGLLQSLGVDSRVSEIMARLCCHASQLPQGAPTSPVLSNMICYRLDTDLLLNAKESRCIYTRYADDITFSSYQPPTPLFEVAVPTAGRFSPDMLAPALRAAITSNGFVVHPDKAHYADRNSRRMVTGVKINDGLNVDRLYVRRVRAMLHSVEKLGLSGAQARYSSDGGKGDLAAHLRGKIAYIAHLKGHADPVVRSLARRYNTNFAAKPIKLTPTAEERRDRSVWVVEDAEHTGTSFFLKGVGLVTAAHCVEGLSEVDVLHPSKHTTTFKVKILHVDTHRDLALLDHTSIPATEFYELQPATKPVAVTDAVTAVGYPDWGYGERLNIRPGGVSLLTIRSGVQMIEVTQQLTQGMSGGPILNANGEVVGVIHKGGPAEGRQLAIKVSELDSVKMKAS